MKDVPGKDRHEHRVLQAEHAHQADEQERGTDGPVTHREAETLNKFLQRRTVALTLLDLGDPHHHQRGDHCEKTDSIQEEAPALPEPSDRETGYGGAYNARAVENRRIESDRVRQVFSPHHLNEKRL